MQRRARLEIFRYRMFPSCRLDILFLVGAFKSSKSSRLFQWLVSFSTVLSTKLQSSLAYSKRKHGIAEGRVPVPTNATSAETCTNLRRFSAPRCKLFLDKICISLPWNTKSSRNAQFLEHQRSPTFFQQYETIFLTKNSGCGSPLFKCFFFKNNLEFWMH